MEHAVVYNFVGTEKLRALHSNNCSCYDMFSLVCLSSCGDFDVLTIRQGTEIQIILLEIKITKKNHNFENFQNTISYKHTFQSTKRKTGSWYFVNALL